MAKATGELAKAVEKILIDKDTIQQRIDELAEQISHDYEGKDLLMVGILTGAAPFYIDLIMRLDLPLQMNFMKVSSYGNRTDSSGNIRILYDLEADVTGKQVLIVEDIIDSGRTLSRLTELLRHRNAHSVRTCTLLDKPSRREVPFIPDFCGTAIPDEFVVGYGLDYNEKYRNLPFVGVLKREIYEKK